MLSRLGQMSFPDYKVHCALIKLKNNEKTKRQALFLNPNKFGVGTAGPICQAGLRLGSVLDVASPSPCFSFWDCFVTAPPFSPASRVPPKVSLRLRRNNTPHTGNALQPSPSLRTTPAPASSLHRALFPQNHPSIVAF